MKTTKVALSTIAVFSLTLTGCAVSSAPSGDPGESGSNLVYASFGGAFQDTQAEAWQVPYTEETGTTFDNDSVDPAKLKAMVDANNPSWDLADLGTADAAAYCEDGLLEEIDDSVIDRTRFAEGTTSDCGVPSYAFYQLMLYNTERFGDDPPTTAADFFDLEKYPGKRMLPPNFWAGLLEFTLIADGVEPEDLYPLDVERAFAKLDTIKSELIFSSSYGEVQQALETQQADMVLNMTARTIIAIDGGAPYAPVWDGVIRNTDTFVIPKGAPNAEGAMEFIDFISQPEQQKRFAEMSGMSPTDPDVRPELTATQELLDPVANGYEDVIEADVDYWSKNRDEVTEQYTAWTVG